MELPIELLGLMKVGRGGGTGRTVKGLASRIGRSSESSRSARCILRSLDFKS